MRLVAILILLSSILQADDSAIHAISVGVPPYAVASPVRSDGDTWIAAWMADGTLVSPGNDNHGFGYVQSSNLNFNRIDGDDPQKLVGTTVNTMTEYGGDTQHGPDNCTWKSSGCISLDGTLYWAIARHEYGEQGGDRFLRQDAHNGSILKSTDGGKTWTRSAQENYDQPEFPGTGFVTPYFVNYGQDGHEAVADGSDKYVCATSNNGYWDNGDYMVLGRCLRADMAKLDRKSWSFYLGGDGSQERGIGDPAPIAVGIEGSEAFGVGLLVGPPLPADPRCGERGKHVAGVGEGRVVSELDPHLLDEQGHVRCEREGLRMRQSR